jgi:hypothetical protein
MRMRFCSLEVERGSPCYPFFNDLFCLGERSFYTSVLKKYERVFRGNIRPTLNRIVPIVMVWLV